MKYVLAFLLTLLIGGCGLRVNQADGKKVNNNDGTIDHVLTIHTTPERVKQIEFVLNQYPYINETSFLGVPPQHMRRRWWRHLHDDCNGNAIKDGWLVIGFTEHSEELVGPWSDFNELLRGIEIKEKP